ncbi:hypothetical protein [Burkholderia sp. Ac-20379]|uniref:hypothetical protein n=1 Tax=Burkholderia sp. Ac-20379 TaxID=2703900 RepID=UPI00197F3745|nr:hypothetical protein [Burkholderia sp. Ac-20379]MBN3727835.1 hypothetical protein [Burkholderia sp. Ac-20379]
MRISAVAPLLLALVSFAAQAATSVTIDAKLNCNQSAVTSGAATGTSASFQLAPGRYVMSVTNNKLNCLPNTNLGLCGIDTVHVQGGILNARWGVAVTAQPIVVDVGSTTVANFFAWVSDDNCVDNSGQATLLIQQAN